MLFLIAGVIAGVGIGITTLIAAPSPENCGTRAPDALGPAALLGEPIEEEKQAESDE